MQASAGLRTIGTMRPHRRATGWNKSALALSSLRDAAASAWLSVSRTAMSAARRRRSRAQFRTSLPAFFAALGVPIIAGRDFNQLDGQGKEPDGAAKNRCNRQSNSRSTNIPQSGCRHRHIYWTDPVMKFVPSALHRTASLASLPIDDDMVPALASLSNPLRGSRVRRPPLHSHQRKSLFTGHAGDADHSDMSVDQPVSAPPRSKTFARSSHPGSSQHRSVRYLCGVALAIALVGVAGVLAFSVSGGHANSASVGDWSAARQLLASVIAEGAVMATAVSSQARHAGTCWCGWRGALSRICRPSALPVVGSVFILLAARSSRQCCSGARRARGRHGSAAIGVKAETLVAECSALASFSPDVMIRSSGGFGQRWVR